mmetsp:Transcript_3903/g.12090  ORF Transcript_3903/g.12090 Transcript_3903/m.12090 type:complete len:209 (-) Transcript_3903:174-800(-)
MLEPTVASPTRTVARSVCMASCMFVFTDAWRSAMSFFVAGLPAFSTLASRAAFSFLAFENSSCATAALSFRRDSLSFAVSCNACSVLSSSCCCCCCTAASSSFSISPCAAVGPAQSVAARSAAPPNDTADFSSDNNLPPQGPRSPQAPRSPCTSPKITTVIIAISRMAYVVLPRRRLKLCAQFGRGGQCAAWRTAAPAWGPHFVLRIL